MARQRPRPAELPAPKVSVRMYCHGLGDCFLVRFPKDDGGTFHLLIDCGVLLGEADGAEKMRAVAADIKAVCGPAGLDLVVITHEHWDHLSGFIQAKEIFDTIPFHKVWFGWTEKPGDPLAAQIVTRLGRRRQALRTAVGLLGLSDDAESRRQREDLHDLLTGFLGPDDALGAAGREGVHDALEWVRNHAAAVEYREPGERLQLPQVPGVTVHVLGPPRDIDAIEQELATRAGDETYLGADVLALKELFADRPPDAALEDLLPEPFDPSHGLDVAVAESDPFFATTYFSEPESWRRIDGDWLGFSERLALQLDRSINNTSLAFALELADGKVLVFPGDAQVGNWTSWDRLKDHNANGPPLDVRALFAKTVFYKVGHHGSHNATVKRPGLEDMADPALTAFIPVSRATAAKQGRRDPETGRPQGWEMPAENLWTRLKEVSSGVFLADEAPKPAALAGLPAGVTVEVKRGLYLEWQLRG